MSEELKPCPFCGCEMHIESNRDWHKLKGEHRAWCMWDHDTDFSWPVTNAAMSNIFRIWNGRHIQEGYKLVPIELPASFTSTHQGLNGALTPLGVRAAYEYLVGTVE